MEALQTMQEPQNGADLVQYVAAVHWMRSAIPNYPKRVAPLRAALEKVFEGKSRRKLQPQCRCYTFGDQRSKRLSKIYKQLSWIQWRWHSRPKGICILTDTSDRLYSGLLTQIDEEQLDLPMEEQDHQPLAFLSGEFKGAQLRWTVPGREGFAIVDTVTKVNYLFLSHDEFSILSDHLNLTYIYNPLSADPTLARHVVHKLQRWALKMYVLSYRMVHVMGEFNYWTDLMTRWGVG
jgi:RNase H-like domain found in reverse transcriptase